MCLARPCLAALHDNAACSSATWCPNSLAGLVGLPQWASYGCFCHASLARPGGKNPHHFFVRGNPGPKSVAVRRRSLMPAQCRCACGSAIRWPFGTRAASMNPCASVGKLWLLFFPSLAAQTALSCRSHHFGSGGPEPKMVQTREPSAARAASVKQAIRGQNGPAQAQRSYVGTVWPGYRRAGMRRAH